MNNLTNKDRHLSKNKMLFYLENRIICLVELESKALKYTNLFVNLMWKFQI